MDERQWRVLVDKALKGSDFERTLVSHTIDGLRIAPLYTRKDEVAGAAVHEALAQQPWDVRQLHAEPAPPDANAAILEDLEGGVTSITLRIAAPEQAGVRVRSRDDLGQALKGVHLGAAGVWLEAGVDFLEVAQALEALWKTRKVARDKALGGFGADPLGALARAGGLPVALEQALSDAAGLAKHCRDTFGSVTALLADGRPYHDGGASETQELACLCATTVAYLRACETEGLEPASALPQIAFALAADADLFLTIAKLRAARLLIARIAEATGAAHAAASARLAATTSLRMMARRDVYTNMLRATVACAGAALGGADAITVLPFTWTLGRPDRFARRIARNVQLVLQDEASLGRVTDPAGGSWAIESLSSEIAAKAWALFQDIEAQGGMARALAEGRIQAMVRETAQARAREVAVGEEKLTGVSAFPHLQEAPVACEPWPLPDELDAAVTVEPIPLRRPAEPFEHLRDASDAYRAKRGDWPKVFAAVLGPLADCSDRLAFVTGLFAAGGMEAAVSEPLTSADAAAKAFKASGAALACLCGSDAAYETLAAAAAKTLTAAGAKHVAMAGRPRDKRAALKAAGVSTFLHPGCDMLAALKGAHAALGIR